MRNEMIIGIDMGGTKISAGVVHQNTVENSFSKKFNANGNVEDVLKELFSVTDQLINNRIAAIGIGIPGLALNGMAYDVYNIPSWKEVPLQHLMEQRYKVPVFVNNDSNCFALGEFYFGKGKEYNSMVGLTLGTGLGTGIIINRKLHSGKACSAGEFGMIPYLDNYYEYYASGQFFQNSYKLDGETVFMNAQNKDEASLKMYEEFGKHLGNALKTILYALDPPIIIMGGSVTKAYPYFEKSMWQQIETIELKRCLQGFSIEISELQNSAILGAAAICYDINELNK